MAGDDSQKALDLIFAEATFTFSISGTQLEGIIDWGSGGLDLTGTVCPAGPLTLVMVAVEDVDGKIGRIRLLQITDRTASTLRAAAASCQSERAHC